MQERCYGKSSTMSSHIGSIKADASRIVSMLAEKEKKIAEITTCPAPCTDGCVSIVLRIGNNSVVQEATCPIISPNCAYDKVLQGQIGQRLAELMVSKIGIPRRHVARFDRCIETIATKEAARWGARGFLVLSGKTGCGKSYAAAWFVDRYLRSRIGDPYQSKTWEWRAKAENAASGVMWSGAQSIVEDRSIAVDSKRASLLILDDLGKESELSSAQAIIRDVISKRYDSERPTIITTELTVTDIGVRYGRALAERVIGEAEDGGRFVTCGDVSLRLIDRNRAA